MLETLIMTLFHGIYGASNLLYIISLILCIASIDRLNLKIIIKTKITKSKPKFNITIEMFKPFTMDNPNN